MSLPEQIRTPRLLLRRFVAADEAAYAAIWADAAVWASLLGEEPDPSFVAERFAHQVGHWERRGYGLFALIEDGGDEIIGWSGPAHADFAPAVQDLVEVGWTLRRPYWGRGLATEAARGALDAVFAHLAVDQAIHLILPTNTRSQAVARRVGATRDGSTRTTSGFQLDVWRSRPGGPGGYSAGTLSRS